jgi:hypothetical protein
MTPGGFLVIAHTAIPGLEHLFKAHCSILGVILDHSNSSNKNAVASDKGKGSKRDLKGRVGSIRHRKRSQRNLLRCKWSQQKGGGRKKKDNAI